MSRTAMYHTTVHWTRRAQGHLVMGNGPEMDFSAPPDAHGYEGIFTPEDAFVAAANTCVMMMFLWATERFKLKLLGYECRTEGTKLIELDRTEIFSRLHFARGFAWRRAASRRRRSRRECGVPAGGAEVQPGRQFGEIGNRRGRGNRDRRRRTTVIIQVLGTGCTRCKTLFENAQQGGSGDWASMPWSKKWKTFRRLWLMRF